MTGFQFQCGKQVFHSFPMGESLAMPREQLKQWSGGQTLPVHCSRFYSAGFGGMSRSQEAELLSPRDAYDIALTLALFIREDFQSIKGVERLAGGKLVGQDFPQRRCQRGRTGRRRRRDRGGEQRQGGGGLGSGG